MVNQYYQLSPQMKGSNLHALMLMLMVMAQTYKPTLTYCRDRNFVQPQILNMGRCGTQSKESSIVDDVSPSRWVYQTDQTSHATHISCTLLVAMPTMSQPKCAKCDDIITLATHYINLYLHPSQLFLKSFFYIS